MGYRIQYGPVRKLRRSAYSRSGMVGLTGLFFLVFMIMVNLLWAEGVEVIRESLHIKGVSLTTAAEEVSDSLKQGENALDIVKTFLNTIQHDQVIHHG